MVSPKSIWLQSNPTINICVTSEEKVLSCYTLPFVKKTLKSGMKYTRNLIVVCSINISNIWSFLTLLQEQPKIFITCFKVYQVTNPFPCSVELLRVLSARPRQDFRLSFALRWLRAELKFYIEIHWMASRQQQITCENIHTHLHPSI